MYADLVLSQPDTSPTVVAAALDREALDDGLALLRQAGNAGPAYAKLNRRLAEGLFYRHRFADAAECGRRALASAAADDTGVTEFCGWLFSNCGCHDEAAAIYERLLDRDPDWIEGHRHASGSWAAAGDLDRALVHAMTASELAPENGEYALHAGSLLRDAGHVEDAIEYLRRALAAPSHRAAAAWALSSALFAIGRHREAAALAVEHAGDDHGAAVHACELLLRCERVDEAAAIVEPVAAAGNPTGLRVLSGVEVLRGRGAAALSAIDRAIAIAPDRADYHLHRGHILYRLSRAREAADAFGRAAELGEGSREAKRAQLAAFLAGGMVSEATAIGGDLLRADPDDAEAAAAVLDLLNRRLDADSLVMSAGGARASRPPRRTPNFGDAVRRQCRVLHALIIRETRTRFGETRLGYGWALIEPILHIALLWAMFAVLMHGEPPLGHSFFVFYLTGLIPYHVFVHASTAMTHAIPSNGSLLQLPLVTRFDVVLARGLLEFVTDVLVAAILLLGLGAVGLGAMPEDLWSAAVALIVVGALGCGAGFINGAIGLRWRSWDRIWVQATRLLYFASGIFYPPGMMPTWVRDILTWNPVLQAIDWFRTGFFAAYGPHWLDRRYLAATALAALLCGLASERALRRQAIEAP